MVISLISAAQLLASGPDSSIAVIDARRRDEFDKEHIPGAVSMSWEHWCADAPQHLGEELAQPGYWGLLKDLAVEEIERKLAAFGLSNQQHIVVYADGPKSKGREGRIAWMLLYYGAQNVSMLDGGFTAWKTAGGAVEQKQTLVRKGDFGVEIAAARRVRLADLRAAAGKGCLPVMLDTRTQPEFDGQCYPYMPRKGTLPNSVLLAYDSIFESDGTFIGKEKYRQLMPEALHKAMSAVAVCEVGVRASTVALLHEIYTGHIMPVYDGSIMEWSAEEDLPMRNSS